MKPVQVDKTATRLALQLDPPTLGEAMTTSFALVTALAELGVTKAFGVSGGVVA
jgi:hypothetical protein